MEVEVRVRMDKTARNEFKAACARNGETISEVIRRLAEMYVKGEVKLK